MGLPTGWVTGREHDLSVNQQLAALGNGVLPQQGVTALKRLWSSFAAMPWPTPY